MAATVIVKQGTGLGYCRICNKLITKEQMCVAFSSYQASALIHRNPEDCVTT